MTTSPIDTTQLPCLLTIDECAAFARSTPSGVRRWIAEQRLPSIRPGRRRLVRRADLLRFLDLVGTEAT
jgi:excisionase family DNA binding protein